MHLLSAQCEPTIRSVTRAPLSLAHKHTHVHTHTHTHLERVPDAQGRHSAAQVCKCVGGGEFTFRSFPDIPESCSLVDASRMLWRSHLLDFFGVGVNSSSVRCRGGPRCGGGTKQNQRRCLNGRFVQLVKHWRKNRAKQDVNSIRFV